MEFRIPYVNPIRFRLLGELDNRYGTFPFDMKAPECTLNGMYYQPWQTDDLTTVQVQSDYTPEDNALTCKVYDLITRLEVLEVEPILTDTNIVGQTWKVYHFDFDFSELPEGEYFAEITYNNELLQPVTWQSYPMRVLDKHENTLLFEYTNSINDFGIIFKAPASPYFSHRVYGYITNYTPDYEDDIYQDQKFNLTKLDSVQFSTFTLFIGAGRKPEEWSLGVEDWAMHLVNWILRCDQKQIDGVYYEITGNAKYEVTRTDPFPFCIWAITIQEVENKFTEQLQTGGTNEGGIIIVQELLKYEENTADITISGKFSKASHLTRIAMNNTGGDTFTLKVGTTNGGSEIAEFEISNPNHSLEVGKMFGGTTTVYLTGLTAHLCDLYIDYKNYFKLPYNPATASVVSRIPKGTCGWFMEAYNGHLEDVWNLATGFGIDGLTYENCVILDGRNGYPDIQDGYFRGVNIADIDTELGTISGTNLKAILESQLPAHYHFIANGATSSATLGLGDFRMALSKNDTVNRDYLLTQTSAAADIGRSSVVGSGALFDVTPKSLILLPYFAYTD